MLLKERKAQLPTSTAKATLQSANNRPNALKDVSILVTFRFTSARHRMAHRCLRSHACSLGLRDIAANEINFFFNCDKVDIHSQRFLADVMVLKIVENIFLNILLNIK